jgi:hypothetical protein
MSEQTVALFRHILPASGAQVRPGGARRAAFLETAEE